MRVGRPAGETGAFRLDYGLGPVIVRPGNRPSPLSPVGWASRVLKARITAIAQERDGGEHDHEEPRQRHPYPPVLALQPPSTSTSMFTHGTL